MIASPPAPAIDSVRFAGFDLTTSSVDELVQMAVDERVAGRGGSILSLNLDILRKAQTSETITGLLSRGDVLIPDGMPIVWANRLAGNPPIERVPGSTLVPKMAGEACRRGLRIMLLGGNPGVAERAAASLRDAHADSDSAVISYFPPFGFDKDPAELERLQAAVKAAEPDIVFVALPFERQEKLIERLKPDHPATWFVACGITLSFMTGDVRRAPDWVQSIGLEWFHRFVQEPRRLFRRYFLEDIPFVPRLLALAIRERVGRGR